MKEWKKHRSKYARLWYVQMLARKKVHVVKCEPNDLCLKLKVLGVSEQAYGIMEKDAHLISAALVSDGLILALDDAARHQFGAVSVRLRVLRKIMWLNPALEQDECETWLQQGALYDPRRAIYSIANHNPA